ncbi:protein-S-isoprenylcysteine O-methyltransferase [Archangium lansingense]|uniref:protein-S-isoprenylcysteine O-methyltransferase n=1 Tax=Archangium lansingense TaxID=2995310 RepID=UPI003B7D5CD8
MAASRQSLMASVPAALMTLGMAALLVATLVRWRDNGWGGLVWVGVMVIMFVIRMPHSLRNRANRITLSRHDALEQALLFAMFLGMMVLPLGHLGTGVFSFADYTLPGWATAVGTVLQVPFLWLFWRSHADLGRNWSAGLEVREEHGLVTHGVYARIRHPMYAAIWLAALTQPLLIHNWIAGALVIPAFASM